MVWIDSTPLPIKNKENEHPIKTKVKVREEKRIKCKFYKHVKTFSISFFYIKILPYL